MTLSASVTSWQRFFSLWQNLVIMVTLDNIEKLNRSGLWFVRSTQPSLELCRYVYDIAVELGKPIVVYSSLSQRDIQNNVIDDIKRKRIEATANELGRNWLEDELSEYNSHGFFWYPENMNDYLPNGSFWSNYVFFDSFKILSFTNDSSDLILIDNLSDLWYEDVREGDKSSLLPLIEKEAIEYKKTIIVFVSSYDSCIDESYMNRRLLLSK